MTHIICSYIFIIAMNITLDELDSELEDLLDVWIASEDMQKILAEEDEVRH